MIRTLYLVFSIFLLVGILTPVFAQTIPDHVVINEVEINPPGNDATTITEWVELYNPTDSDVNLGGWKIASTTVLKKTLTIPSGTIIPSGGFLTYSYQSLWFTDSSESVELRDNTGIVIDKTPVVADINNDFKSWQRIYDGFDFDILSDWKFATSTAGSSNGKLIQTQQSKNIAVTVSADKPSYLFGEVAVITGNVSEEVFTVKPYYQAEKISVDIQGPNFTKTVTLYPDLKLNFITTLNLHQVLGINEGTYNVSVSYAGKTTSTSFYVGNKIVEQQQGLDDSLLSIITDKSQYMPGQQVIITAKTSKVIPFEGLKFTVKDSSGKAISNGILFPTNGEFETNVFLTTVNPLYGLYEINAQYFDQSITTSFELIKDVKEDVPISLWTDKPAYGLGDEIKITGRLNQNWVNILDLEISQTKQTSLSSSGSDSVFKILNAVNVMGDGTFTYSFKIPNNSNRLGDYKIIVSKNIGTASVIAHVVSDPENFVASDKILSITSDKEIYAIGETMTFSGHIKEQKSNSSYKTGTPVHISIASEDGIPLEIIGLPKTGASSLSNGVVAAYDFTAIPDTGGVFSIKVVATTSVFSEGNYVVTAKYLGSKDTEIFSITDPLNLKEGAVISLNKEVFGLDETVFLSGLLPPTGDRSVTITLTKPDGTVATSGAPIDNQRFSWSWKTPITEKQQTIKKDSLRDIDASNYGIYKIKISTNTYSKNIFFKVSKEPLTDSISKTPIFVSAEKSLYKAGEKLKVIGNVILRDQGEQGLVVPTRVTITITDGTFPFKQIHEASVYPNQGGEFTSLFELPITVFDEGPYLIKALYDNKITQASFSVANDFVFGLDEDVTLLVSTDKLEYYPGETVMISGKPNKLIYLEAFDVSISKKTGNEITCGSFICGKHSGPITTIRPSPSGSFSYQFIIPNTANSLGTYEITVDADFETKSIQFNVIEKPPTPKLDTVIEKENRISDQVVSVFTNEKTIDEQTIAPRVFSGSLITPVRGDESYVNIKVSSNSGVCIIGPSDDCLVNESTRKPGQIYDVVEVDGMFLNVRYSGSDARLEKFSIVPESSTAFLPEINWNVEILKDDQVSRFYYQITYKALE